MPTVYSTKDCRICKGKGFIRSTGHDGKLVEHVCRNCGGKGQVRILGSKYGRP